MSVEQPTLEPPPPRRVPFVVYDHATGAILRSGICSETDLFLQTRNQDEAVMEGEASDDLHEVREGKIVPKVQVPDPEADLVQARNDAAALLAATDWMVIRQSETGQPVPADILQSRAEARALLSG